MHASPSNKWFFFNCQITCITNPLTCCEGSARFTDLNVPHLWTLEWNFHNKECVKVYIVARYLPVTCMKIFSWKDLNRMVILTNELNNYYYTIFSMIGLAQQKLVSTLAAWIWQTDHNHPLCHCAIRLAMKFNCCNFVQTSHICIGFHM